MDILPVQELSNVLSTANISECSFCVKTIKLYFTSLQREASQQSHNNVGDTLVYKKLIQAGRSTLGLVKPIIE